MPIDEVSELKKDVLPAGFIVKDVIGNSEQKPLYNYEDWLRELINESPAFMAKTGGARLEAPDQEAHGEADAISSTYCLDFKLAAGQSLMHALRETSWRMIVNGGVTYTTTSRREGPMRGVILYVALRQQSVSNLRKLWDADTKQDCADDIEREVARFLKLLHTRKNLLILFPYVLYTEGDLNYPLYNVCDAVYSDFAKALDLRSALNPGFDSYLAFIKDQHLVIVESCQDGWSLFDRMPLTSSKTFKEIAWRYVPCTQGWLNELVGIPTTRV